MLAPERPSLEHQWAICVFDDLIDYAPNSAHKYQQHFLEPLHHYVSDSNAGVRQAAAYGVGALAVKFPGASSQYATFCTNCIPVLAKVINAAGSREEENISATENCISAVSKVFKHIIGVDRLDEEMITTWLSWLPISEDDEESVHIYGLLMDLLEANNMFLLKSDENGNVPNLPRIVRVLAEGVVNKTIKSDDHPELIARVQVFITGLQKNEKIWQNIIVQMPEEFKGLLSGQGS